MTINIQIRKYQKKDLESCRDLWKELTIQHRIIYNDNKIGGDDPGKYFDEHLLKVGANNLRVATDNGKVIGLSGLIIDSEGVEIEPVIITESYRGKGIGSMLVKSLIDEAKNKNSRYINVKPVARNIKAIEFFHSIGFVNVGHIELFIDTKGSEWKTGINLFNKKFNY